MTRKLNTVSEWFESQQGEQNMFTQGEFKKINI